MKFMIIAALSIIASPALAFDAESVTNAAYKCWNIPAEAEDKPVQMSFDVVFDQRGAVKDISVTDYSPKDKHGEKVVRSASLAIERCSPYRDAEAGKFSIKMRTDIPENSPIDPFK
ncbi:hypothetical protein [Ochrobactrum vermis]|nr:hypothetical protein [Ochrobactrum vermis]PQZ29801.1 hypothetical protein CQZ93_06240 [Ochrobactrum vermis]